MRRWSSGRTGGERAEDLARGAVVDVLALHERVDERRVLREVGEDAQLDLAVVGGEEQAPRLGHERLADAPSLRGPDRDVLQVRVGRGEPARRRDGLVEGRVDAAGLRVDHLRQGVDVRRLELLDLPVLEDEPRQLVHERELLEHVLGRGRRARLRGLLAGAEREAVEEDLAQLDRRVDVELALGLLVDARRERAELLVHVAAHRAQERHVHLHARALHVGEDGDERPLHLVVDREEALLAQPRGHRVVEPQDELGLGAGDGRDGARRGVLGGDAVAGRRPTLAEVLEREVLERVRAPAGVERGTRRGGRRSRCRRGRPRRGRGRRGRACCEPRPCGRSRPRAPAAGRRAPRPRAARPATRARRGREGRRRTGPPPTRARRRGAARASPARSSTTTPRATRPVGARLRDGGVERRPVEDDAVVAGAQRLLRRVLLREDLELELLEEGVAGGPVRLAADDRVEVERHRDVPAQGHQLLGEQRLLRRGPSAPRGRPRASPCRRSRSRSRPGRTRTRGRVPPCRRSRARRARCRPSRRRGRGRPRSASGDTPHFASTALPSRRVAPVPSRPGLRTTTSSLTSWSMSLSAVTTTTRNPAATAWSARVAITSSASKPGTSTIGRRKASHTRRM